MEPGCMSVRVFLFSGCCAGHRRMDLSPVSSRRAATSGVVRNTVPDQAGPSQKPRVCEKMLSFISSYTRHQIHSNMKMKMQPFIVLTNIV